MCFFPHQNVLIVVDYNKNNNWLCRIRIYFFLITYWAFEGHNYLDLFFLDYLGKGHFAYFCSNFQLILD